MAVAATSGAAVDEALTDGLVKAAAPLGGDVSLDSDRELDEVAEADDLAELLLGFEHAGGGPAEAHVAVLPARDGAWRAADGLDHRLARVRGSERALELTGDAGLVIVSVSCMPSRRDA